MKKPKFDWENDDFEGAEPKDEVLSFSQSPILPIVPKDEYLPASTTNDIAFGQLVENTFKDHFATNGMEAISLLAKVDPNNYIKHVVSLVPKQVATKTVTEVITNGVSVSRELIQSLDIMSGVIPATSLPRPPQTPMILPAPPVEYPW